MDLLAYIAEARRLDLDGVDLYGRHFTSYDHDYLWQVKHACLTRG